MFSVGEVISDEEKEFIISCVQEDFRIDGRSCGDYRNVEVRRGVISSANGSALVNLARTQILVGVKADLQECEGNTGRIEISVEFCGDFPFAFDNKDDDVALELSSSLQKLVMNSNIDLSRLSVVSCKFCWVIFVDCVVLQHDGNLLDSLSVGVKSALENLEIPNLTLSREGDKTDIDVSDDPYDTFKLDTQNMPIIVTLSKIGDRFVIDAVPEEEACCIAKVVMMVNSSGLICGLQKQGLTGLDPEYILEMMEFGKSAGQSLLSMIEDNQR